MAPPQALLLAALLLLCASHLRAEGLPAAVLSGQEAFALPTQAPYWRLDQLFTRTVVALSCQSKRQAPSVFTAASAEAALAALNNGTALLARRSPFVISPFSTTFVALRRPAGDSCTYSLSSRFYNPGALAALAGVLLFLEAPRLAQMQRFRMSAGGCFFSLVALILLGMYMYRTFSGRLVALLTFAGGLSAALCSRLLASANLSALQAWPLFLGAYFLVTFVAGVLLVAYTEKGGPNSVMNSAVAVVLRLAGAFALLLGVQDWEAGGGCVALLMAAEAGAAARRARRLRDGEGGEVSPPGSLTFKVAAGAGQRAGSPALFPPAPSTAPRPSGEEAAIVRGGSIFNTSTGKSIKIGGAAYNKLIVAGYVADRVAGTISPPPAAADADAMSPSAKPRRLSADMASHAAARSPSPRGRRPAAAADAVQAAAAVPLPDVPRAATPRRGRRRG